MTESHMHVCLHSKSLSFCFSLSVLLSCSLILTHATLPVLPLPFRHAAVSQEAVVQYEQYEQEVRHLQRLIEEAHRVIQDRPVSTSNIQELQAQILHHEVPSHKAILRLCRPGRAPGRALVFL